MPWYKSFSDELPATPHWKYWTIWLQALWQNFCLDKLHRDKQCYGYHLFPSAFGWVWLHGGWRITINWLFLTRAALSCSFMSSIFSSSSLSSSSLGRQGCPFSQGLSLAFTVSRLKCTLFSWRMVVRPKLFQTDWGFLLASFWRLQLQKKKS